MNPEECQELGKIVNEWMHARGYGNHELITFFASTVAASFGASDKFSEDDFEYFLDHMRNSYKQVKYVKEMVRKK